MSDKELIKQEIERLKHSTPNAYDRGRFMLLSEIEDFIDSLPEEPVSEDFEREYDNYFKEHETDIVLNPYTNCKDIARHFANWQKEQMMRDVVLETKVMKDCDGDGIETPYEEWLTLENTEIPYIPDNLGLKEGDKVKIIIIKEKQQ